MNRNVSMLALAAAAGLLAAPALADTSKMKIAFTLWLRQSQFPILREVSR